MLITFAVIYWLPMFMVVSHVGRDGERNLIRPMFSVCELWQIQWAGFTLTLLMSPVTI